MKEDIRNLPISESDRHDAGLVEDAVQTTAELAEKAVASVFEIVRDVSVEMSSRTADTLGWLETLPRTGFKLARDTNERAHRIALEAINAAERFTVHVIRTARVAGHDAAQLAARTTGSVIAVRKESIAEAA